MGSRCAGRIPVRSGVLRRRRRKTSWYDLLSFGTKVKFCLCRHSGSAYGLNVLTKSILLWSFFTVRDRKRGLGPLLLKSQRTGWTPFLGIHDEFLLCSKERSIGDAVETFRPDVI